jgi:hypothetical protein
MPPDNAGYYYAAYAATAIIYSVYSVMLWSRGRSMRSRLAELERSVQSRESGL